MKCILATTAIVALTASPVLADSHGTDENSAAQNSVTTAQSVEMSDGLTDVHAEIGGLTVQASTLIGEPVYIRTADAADVEIGDRISAPDDNWERIGEIGDVIISADGQIDSVTLDAGGFLGIGERHVSTSMDELKFVADDNQVAGDEVDSYFIVFTGNRAALEKREELDRQAVRDTGASFWHEDGWTQVVGEDIEDRSDATMREQAEDEMRDAARDANAAELTRDERATLTADDLQGLSVYGTSDDRVGEISDLVLTDDGRISHLVIDVGGFLGIGEKPVALPFDRIALRRDDSGALTDGLYATTEFSTEELESMESWEG